MAALIRALETCGRAVALEAVQCTREVKGSRVQILRIPLKAPDQYLELDRLIFVLGHPAMLRRITHAVRENIYGRADLRAWGIGEHGEYGMPVDDPSIAGDADIYIGAMVRGAADYWPDWIAERLAEQGITIEGSR